MAIDGPKEVPRLVGRPRFWVLEKKGVQVWKQAMEVAEEEMEWLTDD